MIAQGELRNLIEYDSDTGLWRWRVRRSNAAKIGWFVGSPHNAGYLTIRIDGVLHLAHRLAWFYSYGTWAREIDHKDGDRTNNRIDNLRIASRSENNANSGVRIDNISGHKGICFVDGNRKKPWRANITRDGYTRQVYFKTLEEAVRWRKGMEINLFGAFVPRIVSSK